MFRRKQEGQNYLERVPQRDPQLVWKENDKGGVTVDMVHRGLFAKIAQGLFATPKVSHIHLDAFGSFIWKQIDGERNIVQIGELVRREFGDKAEPLYQRLAQYFETLRSNHFISFKK